MVLCEMKMRETEGLVKAESWVRSGCVSATHSPSPWRSLTHLGSESEIGSLIPHPTLFIFIFIFV